MPSCTSELGTLAGTCFRLKTLTSTHAPSSIHLVWPTSTPTTSSEDIRTLRTSAMGKLPFYTYSSGDEASTPITSRRKRLTAVALIVLLFFYAMTFGCARPPPPVVSLEHRVERILKATPLIGMLRPPPPSPSPSRCPLPLEYGELVLTTTRYQTHMWTSRSSYAPNSTTRSTGATSRSAPG